MTDHNNDMNIDNININDIKDLIGTIKEDFFESMVGADLLKFDSRESIIVPDMVKKIAKTKPNFEEFYKFTLIAAKELKPFYIPGVSDLEEACMAKSISDQRPNAHTVYVDIKLSICKIVDVPDDFDVDLVGNCAPFKLFDLTTVSYHELGRCVDWTPQWVKAIIDTYGIGNMFFLFNQVNEKQRELGKDVRFYSDNRGIIKINMIDSNSDDTDYFVKYGHRIEEGKVLVIDERTGDIHEEK
jgi:hypothetical protein